MNSFYPSLSPKTYSRFSYLFQVVSNQAILDQLREKKEKKQEAERKKEENKRKKIEKELQCIKKKNIESWSSESDLDDDEDEVEDEYQQEEESSEDLEERVNHVELGMQHSPTKNPEKHKKNN